MVTIYDSFSPFLTKVLVLLVGWCVSNLTFVDALRCVSLLTLTSRSAAIYMMFAWRNTVGATACRQRKVKVKELREVQNRTQNLHHKWKFTNVRVVKASGYQPLFGPEVPGSRRVSTITSM